MIGQGKRDKDRRGGYVFENSLLQISDDPDNALDIGSDDRLFVEGNGNGGGSTTVEAGDGIDVGGDAGAGYTVAAKLSTDAGNVVSFGSDEGLFVPPGGGGTTTVAAGDGIDVTGDAVAGYTVAAELSADANNAAVFGSDNGLFVPTPPTPPAPTTVAAGDGVDVSGDAASGYTVAAELSTDANNQLVFGTDQGLFVPPGAGATTVAAGNGIDVTGDPVAGYTVAAELSTDANNTLAFGTDNGLFVPTPPTPPAPTTVAAGNGIDVSGDPTAGYTVAALPSTDADNRLAFGSDNGLLVPPVDILQNTQNADYTFVAADTGKVVRKGTPASGPVTWTLTDLPIGTAFWVHNRSDNDNIVLTYASNPSSLLFFSGGAVVSGDITIGPGGWLHVIRPFVSNWEAVGIVDAGGGGATTVMAGDGIDVTGDAAAGYTVAAKLSTDANNVAAIGTDDGLFVPSGGGGQTTVAAGEGIQVSGDAGTGYTVAAQMSADANNALNFGSDQGLFVPTVTPTAVQAGDGVAVTGPATSRTVAAKLSTDDGNELAIGSDGGLLAPPFRSFAGVKAFGVGGTVLATDAFKLVYFHTSASQGGSLNMEADAQWPTNSWIYVGGHETFSMVLNAPTNATFTTRFGNAGNTGATSVSIPAGAWAIAVKAVAGIWWVLRVGPYPGGPGPVT